jgi:membrane protein implicated in regulation of membrane protease activity
MVTMTVLVALGVSAIFAAVSVPAMFHPIGGWPLLTGGVLTTSVALVVLWRGQERRRRLR